MQANGWRVLHVHKDGPCGDLDAVVFFDFLVGVNGHRLDMNDTGAFFRTVEIFQGKELTVTLFNYKTKETRTRSIIPNENWGGEGALGLQISNDSFSEEDETVIKVKNVRPNSPGLDAGFKKDDFILATSKRCIKNLETFKIILNQHRGSCLDFWVYHPSNCEIRKVNFQIPNRGAIGLEVSDGFLNQIPQPKQPITMQSPKKPVIQQAAVANPVEVNEPKQTEQPKVHVHSPVACPEAVNDVKESQIESQPMN